MLKTTVVLVLFLAALLTGFFVRNMSPPPAKVLVEETEKEHFMQRERGMPLDMQATENGGNIPGYSGVSPLLGSEPKPTPEKPYDMANDNELYQFQNNRVSADCCPSPFSSDRGCVCLTDAQIKEFESRGGNRA